MPKIALIFPGQGSQAVGMGKSFFEKDDKTLKPIRDSVEKVLGTDFLKLMLEGPDTQLGLTINTQPALFTVSAAVVSVLSPLNIKPIAVAGHSLGEYSALYAAGVLGFEEGLSLVRTRGQLMEKAMPAGTGTMAAIMGLDPDKIKQICAETKGVVEVANYNNDAQTIISGEKEAVLSACDALKAAGAKRAIELSVSGPFHSSLMKPAAKKLEEALAAVSFKEPSIPVVNNVTADIVTETSAIKAGLVSQLYSSVLWMQTVKRMLALGVDTFVECGSGKVLTGIIKRISSEVTLYNIETADDVEKLKVSLAV